jgi:hypothetical protein
VNQNNASSDIAIDPATLPPPLPGPLSFRRLRVLQPQKGIFFFVFFSLLIFIPISFCMCADLNVEVGLSFELFLSAILIWVLIFYGGFDGFCLVLVYVI